MSKKLIDPDDLVTPSMIADDLGVSRGAVSNWVTRDMGFPPPVLTVGYDRHAPTLLYSRTEVYAWHRNR